MPIPAAPFNPDLLEDNQRVFVRKYYQDIVAQADDWTGRLKTPFPSKKLSEIPGLMKEILQSQEDREGTVAGADFVYTTDHIDSVIEQLGQGARVPDIISYSVQKSTPGGRGRGSPTDQPHRELKPMLRENVDDPNNPGYKLAIMGQWIDSIVRLTCSAPTSIQAERRANWLISTLRENTWWITMSGVSRFYFWERRPDEKHEVRGNKIYSKPIDFFVRTEDIIQVSEKKIEDILVSISIESL